MLRLVIICSFGPALLNTGVTEWPVPRYFLNLSPNPNFAQNSLAGANYDASYPFAGSTHAVTAFHIREDSVNHLFGAVEQRLAWQRSYLVASIAPLNHSQKQENILGQQQLGTKTQLSGFAQENVFQHGLSQPLDATAYVNLKLTQALHGSYLQTNVDQYYESLLGDPQTNTGINAGSCDCFNHDLRFVYLPNHPVDVGLTWTGFDRKIGRLPLLYRLRSGYGWSHDHYGVVPVSGTSFGSHTFTDLPTAQPALIGVGIPTISYNLLGATFYTPSLRLTRDRHGNDLNLNLNVDLSRQAFSLPHQVNTASTTVSLSKVVGTRLAFFAAYSILNTKDNYGSQQLTAYLPSIAVSPQTQASDSGFLAFHGFATSRALTESIVFTPTAAFNASLALRQNTDFPAAVPGYFGLAPLSITGDVRVRLREHLRVDLSRSYYFNFGTQRYSPQFGILVGG